VLCWCPSSVSIIHFVVFVSFDIQNKYILHKSLWFSLLFLFRKIEWSWMSMRRRSVNPSSPDIDCIYAEADYSFSWHTQIKEYRTESVCSYTFRCVSVFTRSLQCLLILLPALALQSFNRLEAVGNDTRRCICQFAVIAYDVST